MSGTREEPARPRVVVSPPRDDPPVLPRAPADETDSGWGGREPATRRDATETERLRRERPPHHGGE